jgi:uncharacterized protein involved in exopolysaccharide biosynthesis
MYDMTSTPAYESDQQIIIAPEPRGNNSESVEEGFSGSSGLFGLSGSTK